MDSYWLVILEADDEIWAIVQTGRNETDAAVHAASDLARTIDESASLNCALGPFKTKVEALQEYNFRYDGGEFTTQYEVQLFNEPIDLEQISYPPECEAMITEIAILDQSVEILTAAKIEKLSLAEQQSLDIVIDHAERKAASMRESLHQRNTVEVTNG